MSLDLQVYTCQPSDNLIPQIVHRLNEYEMSVEIHPDFSFVDHSGFLPFKFRLTDPPFDILRNKELKSGFEIYIDDFSLELEKEKLKPKLSFIDKIKGKKQADIPFASPEIEERLKHFDKCVSFVWHVADSFELRFAALASAILSQLTNGVCCYPADGIWYDNKNIVEEAYHEIKQYEQSWQAKDLIFHEFDQW